MKRLFDGLPRLNELVSTAGPITSGDLPDIWDIIMRDEDDPARLKIRCEYSTFYSSQVEDLVAYLDRSWTGCLRTLPRIISCSVDHHRGTALDEKPFDSLKRLSPHGELELVLDTNTDRGFLRASAHNLREMVSAGDAD